MNRVRLLSIFFYKFFGPYLNGLIHNSIFNRIAIKLCYNMKNLISKKTNLTNSVLTINAISNITI